MTYPRAHFLLPAILIGVLTGSRAVSAQAPAPPPAQAAGAAQKPVFQRAPDALDRVTWRTRTLVGDDRLTKWKFAIPASVMPTFLDGVVRADAAVVDFVEGSSTQQASPQIQKPLTYRLEPDEIAALRGQMGTVRMLAYGVETLGADAAARRNLFAFAKTMGVTTIVAPFDSDWPGLDALADEAGINVAFVGDAAVPARTAKALEGRSKRLGIVIDTGALAQDGVSARDALAAVKDRLLYVSLRDRSARGANARNVPLGQGVGQLTEFFHELNRLSRPGIPDGQRIGPLVMTLHPAGVANGSVELFKAIDAFEAAVQPAYGEHFTEYSKSRPIRWDVTPARGETLTPEIVKKRSDDIRQRIDAAIPRQAYAKPKKARKLLVIESLHGMSHSTIPLKNVMLERMGKITGAWEAEFSNDLNNLKYPKIKDYDGVFLNDIVGEFLPDLAAREGLSRFVREGGGLGGVHGTPWASRNWDEFAEMIGAQSAPHRIEQGVMKVYDAASPIVKPFDGQDLNFREEYYRFEHEGRGRLRWDKVRVLLTVALDDPNVEPRPWNGYKRPDNVYPVTWIRSYGKGRMFYTSLGHMDETFMTPAIVGHFLAGVQFLLGDLEADTTPNPRP